MQEDKRDSHLGGINLVLTQLGLEAVDLGHELQAARQAGCERNGAGQSVGVSVREVRQTGVRARGHAGGRAGLQAGGLGPAGRQVAWAGGDTSVQTGWAGGDTSVQTGEREGRLMGGPARRQVFRRAGRGPGEQTGGQAGRGAH